MLSSSSGRSLRQSVLRTPFLDLDSPAGTTVSKPLLNDFPNIYFVNQVAPGGVFRHLIHQVMGILFYECCCHISSLSR